MTYIRPHGNIKEKRFLVTVYAYTMTRSTLCDNQILVVVAALLTRVLCQYFVQLKVSPLPSTTIGHVLKLTRETLDFLNIC